MEAENAEHVLMKEPAAEDENETLKFSLTSEVSGELARTPESGPTILAALNSMIDHPDHMVLPHCLHQVAEMYFSEKNYGRALQFLHLEQLYHERLLSNLRCIQEEWESQWKIRSGQSLSCQSSSGPSSSGQKINTETVNKSMSSLSLICTTHQRPLHPKNKDVIDLLLKRHEEQMLVQKAKRKEEEEEHEHIPESPLSLNEGGEDDQGNEDEVEDEDEEESVGGVIAVEETSPSAGLVSILKRRASDSAERPYPKTSTKPKVRFSGTDDTLDPDEVGGDSCLIFLLLCSLTVFISMGGTMLYCFLGGAYSNICMDFSQNMEFYLGPVRGGVASLTHWFIPTSSASS